MVHTAEFYIKLNIEDIDFLSVKYGQAITLVSEEINKKYDIYGITATITKMKFSGWYMFVIIDFIKLVNSTYISDCDRTLIEEKINSFVSDIFERKSKELILIRIDYRFDAVIESELERGILFHIYRKTLDKYKFKKKYAKYDSSIYFNSKSLQCIIYDKTKQRLDCNEELKSYESNIIRFEVRVKNRHLNYRKAKYDTEKRLLNYLYDDEYKKYMYEQLKVFLYEGDYYKLYRAEKLINSSLLKNIDKCFIREFLTDVSKLGMTGIQNLSDNKGKFKYSVYKFRKAIDILEQLKINPILIPKNMKGPSFIKNPFNY